MSCKSLIEKSEMFPSANAFLEFFQLLWIFIKHSGWTGTNGKRASTWLLYPPRCSSEELWAASLRCLWLQREEASAGVTEQSWCPVLMICRNREVNLSLCSNVQECKAAQTLGFFVSESFRCKCKCCCGLPSVSLQLLFWSWVVWLLYSH